MEAGAIVSWEKKEGDKLNEGICDIYTGAFKMLSLRIMLTYATRGNNLALYICCLALIPYAFWGDVAE